MSFRRHRAQQSHAQPRNDNDDDDEDDVFSALSRKRSKKKAKVDASKQPQPSNNDQTQDNPGVAASATGKDPPGTLETPVVASTTSSMKRHHKPLADHRRAKMEETLAELQFHQQTESLSSRQQNREKKRRHGGGGGSYVEPGQEHVTTNIFVSNLATNLTEEALHKVFGSFGTSTEIVIFFD